MNRGLDSTLEEVAERIAGSGRSLVVGHVRSDADCVGSMAGLALALRGEGKEPTVAVQRTLVPQRMLQLFDWAGVTPTETPDLEDVDLVIALDTAAADRLNIACGSQGLAGRPMVCVDHHATNTRFGDWNFIRSTASSTSELVFELLTELRWEVTPAIATQLYAGIHGDTGGFSLPNTTDRSLEVASRLSRAGARIPEVCQHLCRSMTRNEFELLALVYANTRSSEDGSVTWSTLTHQEIVSSGCSHSDIDDQVVVPRSLEGTRIAILFSEGLPGSVRLNVRSEGDIDVLPLIREFGGGGHRNAAGTSIKNQPIDEVVQRVIRRTVEYLAERYPR
ncbi:MAG: bifunctional oligoribonuclease/PAP phosphatase NrnA [Phycisphaerae bacterium]|nr:bifunctional oligoribonuclease/PAP phosphatase NrnA [Phycisphaerae bacterium]